jgi:hypothetical protein
MVDVSSRPESIHELYPPEEQEEDEGVTETGNDHEKQEKETKADTKSIRSVSSMMSKEDSGSRAERASLSNRLASIGVLGRLSGPQSTTLAEEALGSSPPDNSPSKVSHSRFRS